MSMFCYQCEQTAKGTGCTVLGVCGKDENTANIQNAMVYAVKGISMYAYRAGNLYERDEEVDRFVTEALFATLTNVDFDSQHLLQLVKRAVEMKDRARLLYEDACSKAGCEPEALNGPAEWQSADNIEDLAEQGQKISIELRKERLGEDITGLQELITYGLKGVAAYAYHARILGKEDVGLYADMHEALDFLTKDDPSVDELLGWALKTGELNLKAMELLDDANTSAYGQPEPTAVRVTPVKGKAILVSGHDLKDLEELLKQTEGKGVNIYTHGEMLPAHAYPGLKKYPQLVGNYGGAWQDQHKEFDQFPGAILMTTNCIQKPRDSYKDRIFTTGPVAWPGVRHLTGYDFTPVIDAAMSSPGFSEDEHEKTIMVGFGRNAVMNVAGTVIEAVKSGAIRHFFLVGGCDGAKSGRNYYTKIAQQIPDDCVILTLACGKYRFNKLDFGDIGGIPRLLDIGQCNDAYSAIQIAIALADAFGTDVNGLPLSFIVSWYEQKAVAILLTLLYLDIKNIKLGPSLPAFITPAVLNVLVDKFNISSITTPEGDLKTILGDYAKV